MASGELKYVKPTGATTATRRLPKFEPPQDRQLWELGRVSRHPRDLEDFLDASQLDDGFHVADGAAEAHLAQARRLFDESAGSMGRGLVGVMVSAEGGDDPRLLKRVLALGLDPDLEEKERWRPSHICSRYSRVECARVLAMCRPCLAARNRNDQTPAMVASKSGYPDKPPCAPESELEKTRPLVLEVWEGAEKRGFPSIAKLAADGDWWAVKNLCRRRVVGDEEALAPYGGRGVIEWAEVNGEAQMAAELRYYFKHVILKDKLAQMEKHVQLLNEKMSEIERFRVETQSLSGQTKEMLSAMQMRILSVEQSVKEKEEAFVNRIESLTKKTETSSSNVEKGAWAGKNVASQEGPVGKSGFHSRISKLVRELERTARARPCEETVEELRKFLHELNPYAPYEREQYDFGLVE